jgi:hypothetical protein
MDSIKKKMQSLSSEAKAAEGRVATFEEEIRMTNVVADASEEQIRDCVQKHL